MNTSNDLRLFCNIFRKNIDTILIPPILVILDFMLLGTQVLVIILVKCLVFLALIALLKLLTLYFWRLKIIYSNIFIISILHHWHWESPWLTKRGHLKTWKILTRVKKTVSYAIVNFKFYSLINKLTLFKGSCF